MTFDDLEFQQAWEEVYRSVNPGDQGPQQVEIAMSTDGRNWETISSGEPGFFPNSVAVGGDSLLLSGWTERGGLLGLGGGGPQLILVHAG